MTRKLALEELRVKSFETRKKQATGGQATVTCFICTSPHPACASIDDYTICEFCFP